jgi:glycine cleavage system aminomethyltransferase T
MPRVNAGQPKRTPLYDAHRASGAKLIDFGGWMMPVNYPPGFLEEHRTTRSGRLRRPRQHGSP